MVAIQSMRDLGVGPDSVNVNGGAIAIGHPIGASGARLVAAPGLRAQPPRRRARRGRPVRRRRPGRRADPPGARLAARGRNHPGQRRARQGPGLATPAPWPGFSRWSRTSRHRSVWSLRTSCAAPGRPGSSGSPVRRASGSRPSTGALVGAFRSQVRRVPGGRARGGSDVPVHRRRAARRPGPHASPRHRRRRVHQVDGEPRPAWRAGGGYAAGPPRARRGRVRPDPRGDGRRGPGRGRHRLARGFGYRAGRAGDGRRDPGGQGRHSGDRGPVRGQQGRQAGQSPGGARTCAA